MYTVYLLTSPRGRHYVGYTSRPLKKRLQDHVSDAKRLGRSKMHRAINKYPIETWAVEVLLQTPDRDEALDEERKRIDDYDSIRSGYNISVGGECGAEGAVRSAETRARISEAKRGHRQFSDPEYRRKLSEARLGKARPQSQKDKARETLSQHREVRFIDGSIMRIRGLREFSEKTGIPLSTLNYCQRHKVEVPKWNLKSIEKLNSRMM